jgi:hypothetical protein
MEGFDLTSEEFRGAALILGVLAVGGFTCLPWFRGWLRGYKMRQQRREEIQTILADAFTEVIVDKIILGQLTKEEGLEEGYLRLKRAYPECKDLYPSEATLKERIEKRLKNGDHHPVALPTGERKLMFARRK